MLDNKEEKKGFWSTLFAPKKNSSCCCGSQTEVVPEEVEKADAPSCCCCSAASGAKVIKVLGTGCSGCKALYATVQEAVAQLGIDATVEKEEDLQQIMAYNVMSLPALVVDGRVVSKGQKLTVEQVKELLR
ncbi:MAG: thioredoxin family protein [Prevotella sp.]|nr:thioredoxin family protein [Prevotella sp.]